jgi:glucose/arabinose dehydrogenase
MGRENEDCRMTSNRRAMPAVFCIVVAFAATPGAGSAQETRSLVGPAAFGSWQEDAPGVRRLILPDDLPQPGATRSASGRAGLVRLPQGVAPTLPDGFRADLFAAGLSRPRTIRVAPNGDIFVAESGAGRVLVLRAAEGASEPSDAAVFAAGFNYPYGIAFYPPGPEPQWVYVGETGRVVRFPYRSGDLEARGDLEVIVPDLPTGGHSTRDIAFSPDGARLYVAVGSASNAGERIGDLSAEDIAAVEAEHGLGAGWGDEEDRAAVLAFDPDGADRSNFANGIRNCSGLAVQPETGDLWCAVNERDGLGDNLPPDYVSRIGEGKFYGWPWYYIGDHQDPRHRGQRPDLAAEITVPDVLIQAHSAPLGIVFYDGEAFPAAYRGDGFVTLHGSWNRSTPTGYKVVRVIVESGMPTGEYEDFATGFVLSGGAVWGRPVGIAVAKDGALLVSEDGNGTIWRIASDG